MLVFNPQIARYACRRSCDVFGEVALIKAQAYFERRIWGVLDFCSDRVICKMIANRMLANIKKEVNIEDAYRPGAQ